MQQQHITGDSRGILFVLVPQWARGTQIARRSPSNEQGRSISSVLIVALLC